MPLDDTNWPPHGSDWTPPQGGLGPHDDTENRIDEAVAKIERTFGHLDIVRHVDLRRIISVACRYDVDDNGDPVLPLAPRDFRLAWRDAGHCERCARCGAYIRTQPGERISECLCAGTAALPRVRFR